MPPSQLIEIDEVLTGLLGTMMVVSGLYSAEPQFGSNKGSHSTSTSSFSGGSQENITSNAMIIKPILLNNLIKI